MTPDEMGKLHGVWRDVSGAGSAQSHPKPELASLAIKGQALTVGDRVRLKPRKGGDAMDIVLAGKIAIVEAIERDFEDRVHVAVVIADDPGRDFGLARLPGHRFFFAPEEVERWPCGGVMTGILIAGVGNIFQGDDGFGVEVAQRLVQRRLGPGVEVIDFGIRGIDLTYALMDGIRRRGSGGRGGQRRTPGHAVPDRA